MVVGYISVATWRKPGRPLGSLCCNSVWLARQPRQASEPLCAQAAPCVLLSSCFTFPSVGVATGLDLCSQHQGFAVFACDTFFCKGPMGRNIEHVGILGFLVKMHTCCVGVSLPTLLLS